MHPPKFLLASLVAFALVLGAFSARAEPVKLRLAWVIVPYEVAPVLFAKRDVMVNIGKTYDIELVHFASSPAMISAYATGDLDIATLSTFALSNTIENAVPDTKIIFDEYQDGVKGYYSGKFVVLKDGPIKSIADLKGGVTVAMGIGSSGDMAIRVMLRKHGLEEKRDYTMLEATPVNMLSMLKENKAQLMLTAGPTARDPAVVAETRVLFDRRQALDGPSAETLYVVRQSVLDKERAPIVDMLEDYLRALRWFTDPANHAEAIQLVSDFTKIPADQLQWMFTSDDEYRDPNGIPNVEAVQRGINELKAFSVLKTGLDIKDHVDLSLAKEAASRIK
jgi:sulfonate transport system substrate-binding protein